MLSRYYDPEIGQFISPDMFDYLDPETIGGVNLYAYCFNNPVMGYDPTGHWDWNLFAKVIAGVALVAAAVAVTVFTGGVAGAVASVALGAAAGGFVGGLANEAQGGSFIGGWIGGAINGTIQTLCSLAGGFFGKAVGEFIGTVVGGFFGSFTGTFTMQNYDNAFTPGIQRSQAEIISNSLKAGVNSAATSVLTGYMNYSANLAAKEGWIIGGDYLNGVAGTTIGRGSARLMGGFFSIIDDAAAYFIYW